MRYSDERREAILKQLFPPHSPAVAEVAGEEGISTAALSEAEPAGLTVSADRGLVF